jgi:PAS domain S-box-containing protein
MATAFVRRSDYLAQASLALSSSLDFESTLWKVAGLALETLADWCAVYVLDPGPGVRQVLLRHRDPAKVDRAREFSSRYPLNLEADSGIARVLRTGQPELISPITDEHLKAWTANPEQLGALREARMSAAIVVPLRAQGKSVGAMALVSTEPGRLYTEQDFAVAMGLSEHAGVALENARLYQLARSELAERTRAEEALRESERRLRALFEGTLEAVFVLDDDGRCVDVNPAACRLTGYARDELVRKGVWDLVPPAERESLQPRWEKLVARGSLEGGGTLQTKDGGVRDVEFGAVAHFLPRLHMAFVRDVSARRQAEESVRELNRSLERRVESRTRELRSALHEMEAFSYTVAHDLRAPLRVMTSFSQILREEHLPESDREGRDLATRLEEAARRMDALVQDLLSYSRLTREDLPLEKVDLALLARIVVDQMRDYLNSKKALVAIDPDLPPVRAHPLALSRSLSNLIENAAKFVPEGRAPRIWVGFERRGPRVRLLVEDNGIGISPEYHERIFGLFERLHEPDVYPGTGIGLAIVKRAAEKMGGTAGVHSDPGHGSQFFVELDAAPPEPAPPNPANRTV